MTTAEANEQALTRKIEELQAELDEQEEAEEEERRENERLIAELQKTIAEHKKAVDERDAKIAVLQAEASRRSESREQAALRAELESLQGRLAAKDDELDSVRTAEREAGRDAQSIAAAVRAAEGAGAQKLAEEQKKHSKAESELTAKAADAASKLDAAKKRYTSLSEKFAQREDVIVELRARMDEYERGVHGLREEVQEKERFKALHDQRSEEARDPPPL